MADIFTEVWNQVRADRARSMWVRVAPYAAAGALLVIGGVGGYEFLSAQREARYERASYVFEDGLGALGERDDEEDDDVAAAREYFSRAMDSNYASLASMYLADLELREAGDEQAGGDGLARQRAIKALELGASGKDVWARMARLKLGYLVADGGSVDEVEVVLDPLISAKDGYDLLAREIIAVTASQQGDTDRARLEYQRILDSEDADRLLRLRAEAAIGFMDAAPLVRIKQAAPADVGVPTDDAAVLELQSGEQQIPAQSAGQGVAPQQAGDVVSAGVGSQAFAPSLAPGGSDR